MIYAYCRVSSGKQLEGLSMSLQGDEALLGKLAKDYNTTVSERVYRDEGKSAYKGEHLRGELGKLLADIDSGVIKDGDIIVMRHLDRLSRLDFSKSMNLFNGILGAGIGIYTTMDNRLYSNKLGNSEQAIYNALAGFAFSTANEESVRKSYYINKNALAQIERFQRGERTACGHAYDIGVGHHPFWVTTRTDNGRTIKNPPVRVHADNYKIAKELVQYALQGNGITRCQQLLEKHGLSYSKQGIRNIFDSAALYGCLKISIDDKQGARTEFVLDGYYPAVCSKEEFYQLQSERKKRTVSNGNRKEYSLLSGARMLHCECGQSLNVHHSKNGAKYYICATQKHNMLNCYTLDNLVLNALKQKVFNVEIDDSRLKSLEAELGALTAEYQKKQKFVLDNIDLFDDSAKAEIATMKANVGRLEQKVEAERQAVLSAKPAEALDLSTYDKWTHQASEIIEADSETKRVYSQKIKQLVNDIVLHGDGLVEIKYIDRTTQYYYFPENSRKKQGEYWAVKLQIIDDDSLRKVVQADKDMAVFVFSTEEINAKKYVNSIDKFKAGLTLYSRERTTNTAQQRFASQLKAYLLEHGELHYKRSEVVKLGISDSRWQKLKDTDLSQFGIKTKEKSKVTSNGIKRIEKTIYVEELK
ncbi:TPA: recombinase family protein [Vibrio parahaemolyticus]|nr:recombinase family protein [Vibrio parahaemolyticus]